MTVHVQSPPATRQLTSSRAAIPVKNKKNTREATQLTENKHSKPKTKAIYNPPITHSNPFTTHLKPIYNPFSGPKNTPNRRFGGSHTLRVADHA
jgi:hypothetical protein